MTLPKFVKNVFRSTRCMKCKTYKKLFFLKKLSGKHFVKKCISNSHIQAVFVFTFSWKIEHAWVLILWSMSKIFPTPLNVGAKAFSSAIAGFKISYYCFLQAFGTWGSFCSCPQITISGENQLRWHLEKHKHTLDEHLVFYVLLHSLERLFDSKNTQKSFFEKLTVKSCFCWHFQKTKNVTFRA